MKYTIRIATENDLKAVYKLNLEFAHFIRTPEKFNITVEQMIEEQEYFQILVLEKDGAEIIGFATTFIAWYSWSGKSMYLDDLYISEAYRGQGLGSKLMNEVFEMARAENCKKVKWTVSKWNQNAIEFYKSKGAEIDEVEIPVELILK